jgi:hypothetical protein
MSEPNTGIDSRACVNRTTLERVSDDFWMFDTSAVVLVRQRGHVRLTARESDERIDGGQFVCALFGGNEPKTFNLTLDHDVSPEVRTRKILTDSVELLKLVHASLVKGGFRWFRSEMDGLFARSASVLLHEFRPVPHDTRTNTKESRPQLDGKECVFVPRYFPA